MICKLKYILLLVIVFQITNFAQYDFEVAFPNLNFSSALDLQNAGDGTNRLFVVEQVGRIRVFENQTNVNTTSLFLDITDRVTAGGETGLLGLAFHPDYETNGYFYVNYTSPTPSLKTVISRFQVSSQNPDSADKNSELILLTYNQPYSNHNGGCIAFGPDGYLYISAGDGGSGGDPQNNAQNITNLLGKIIRIDVNNPQAPLNYGIPAANPFMDSTNVNICKEIFAWGLRNTWRFSFDPVTGWLWAGDVGQGEWEEVDIVQNGKNYGWRCYEGTHPYDLSGCNGTYEAPIWEYLHFSVGGYSITGGYVYRGQNVPELVGKYIYGDYVSRNVWSLEYDGVNPTVNTQITQAPGPITSFGIDEDQELYLVSFNGKIFKFIPSAVPVELISFNAIVENGNVRLNWYTTSETNNAGFKIERSNEVVNYEEIFFIGGNGTITNRNVYSYLDESVSSGVYYYRLKQINYDGSFEYLNVIAVDLGIPEQYLLEQNYPNPFNPKTIIVFKTPAEGHISLKVYDVLGKEVATLLDEKKQAGSYDIELDASQLTSGIYLYKLTSGSFNSVRKMIVLK